MKHLLVTICFLLITINGFAAYEVYSTEVHPLLEKYCYKCHSIGAEKIKGEFLLDSKQGWLKGGESGESAIVPYKPMDSLLVTSILHQDSDLAMPPKEKMPQKAIDTIIDWIKKGAQAPNSKKEIQRNLTAIKQNLWSLKPLKYSPPKIEKDKWVIDTIDKYILEKIQQKKLTLVTDASPQELIRRAYYDLTGLPPTPNDVLKYSKNFSSQNYQKLIESLLKSPRFGEHWGRHWLDVVRYADTTGQDGDLPLPYAWRYRDYIINAFNKDLPYNKFIQQQVAGDLFAKNPQISGNLYAATGLLTIGKREVRNRNRLDEIDDQLDIIGKAFLGISIGCARCHDHKFDPFSIEDYYSMAGIFLSTDFLGQGVGQLISGVSKDEQAVQQLMQVSEARFQINFINRRIKNTNNNSRKKALQKTLKYYQDIVKNTEKFSTPINTYSTVKDSFPHNTYVRINGDDKNKGETVRRNAPQTLFNEKTSISKTESGRLDLAKWLTSDKNPLTARVMVNRIWQHLMGKGLVNTSNDFGNAGDKPTHPELLDYLTRWFIKNNWSTKELIKKIMLSHTYQLSSQTNEQSLAIDPDNDYIWHHYLQRLSAEEMRDSLLLFSGDLDFKANYNEFLSNLSLTRVAPQFNKMKDIPCRTVYLPISRSNPQTFLENFNFPDGNLSIGKRFQEFTVNQSLFLYNNKLVHKTAKKLTKKILKNYPKFNLETLKYAYLEITSQYPISKEIAIFADYFEAEISKQSYNLVYNVCHILLSSYSFIYIK